MAPSGDASFPSMALRQIPSMSAAGGPAAADPRPWRAEEASPEEGKGIDHFDRLPDSVLLVVFNLVGDVKALGRCCVVCHRFHDLAQLVESVLVRVDCVLSDDSSPSLAGPPGGDRARGFFSHLARIVLGGIVKPLHALGHILTPSVAITSSRRSSPSSHSSSSSSAIASSSEVSHHSPSEVLKNFKEIRRLRIELPAGELGVDDGVLLKWKAEFGSTLDSCVILGAASVLSSASISPKSVDANPSLQESCVSDDSGSIPESFYSNGNLKLRLFWTISSLIAASARHFLLQPIINEHEALENLELTDVDGQGLLTMGRRQLQDFRVNPVSASGSAQRTLVPALSMRLWYAPYLELPGGIVLKGATLVAVRPSQEWGSEVACGECGGVLGSSDMYWISSAFEEPFMSAAGMLVKRRSYCLEMNSF